MKAVWRTALVLAGVVSIVFFAGAWQAAGVSAAASHLQAGGMAPFAQDDCPPGHDNGHHDNNNQGNNNQNNQQDHHDCSGNGGGNGGNGGNGCQWDGRDNGGNGGQQSQDQHNQDPCHFHDDHGGQPNYFPIYQPAPQPQYQQPVYQPPYQQPYQSPYQYGGQPGYPPPAPPAPPLYTAVFTPPAAPVNLQANLSYSGSVTFSWSPASGTESGYWVYAPYPTPIEQNVTGTSFTLPYASPGGYYCLTVIAYNAAGYSAWSNWSCTTLPFTGAGGYYSGYSQPQAACPPGYAQWPGTTYCVRM